MGELKASERFILGRVRISFVSPRAEAFGLQPGRGFKE